MSSSRPYLIRALYEWLADNDLTPYIAVDATIDNVMVPEQHVHDGQIVLNIAMSSVRELDISNEAISFSARFGGVPQHVYVPVMAVMAIYARENAQGMAFGQEPEVPDPEPDNGLSVMSESLSDTEAEPSEKKSSRPSLKVVK
ncbi:ClpXP protease specificity-enhancing factor [Oceanospirillum sediminis]|uniref:ClpXP protease specificity-enhancing factor n=1 Tax=Oceanospirillum sediminis TaxID=2760088 RepID=A0A839ILB2_9GAMM|nr:ClpXP protease specificity-enhancing factor [Oceanospirillum sediminis]MBB1485494.1 ClpXP protease specificity-enhancing factor [Oceanospirillum sediminis]